MGGGGKGRQVRCVREREIVREMMNGEEKKEGEEEELKARDG